MQIWICLHQNMECFLYGRSFCAGPRLLCEAESFVVFPPPVKCSVCCDLIISLRNSWSECFDPDFCSLRSGAAESPRSKLANPISIRNRTTLLLHFDTITSAKSPITCFWLLWHASVVCSHHPHTRSPTALMVHFFCFLIIPTRDIGLISNR